MSDDVQVVGWLRDGYGRRVLPIWLNVGVAVDAANLNTISIDLVKGCIIWDSETEQYRVVYGYEPDEYYGETDYKEGDDDE